MKSLKSEVSKKSKYYLEKHRALELRHFCLQYPYWRKWLSDRDTIRSSGLIFLSSDSVEFADPVFEEVRIAEVYLDRIGVIERACMATDPELAAYILQAVCYGRSYEYLRAMYKIPCGRRQFYEKYRKFFYLLNSQLLQAL